MMLVESACQQTLLSQSLLLVKQNQIGKFNCI